MRIFMRTALLTAVLLAGTSVVGAQVSVGIRIGPPPPPRVVRVVPANPGPGYVWLEGYWYPVGGHYRWHQGYWTRPPYEGAVWVGPRHDGERFYEGHWDGAHGYVAHDHRWDRDHDRDAGRWHDGDDHHDNDSR